MPLLSYEEAAGAGANPASSSSSPTGQPQSPALISFEDAAQAGQPDSLSAESMHKENVSDTLHQVVGTLKGAGGDLAMLADMALSAPKFTLATGAELGAGVKAVLEGRGKDAFTIGREAGHQVMESPYIPLPNMPIQKIMAALGQEDLYSHSATPAAMEKFGSLMDEAGKQIEDLTNGRIPRDAVPMFVDTVMTGLVGLGPKERPGAISDAALKRVQKAAQETAEKMQVEPAAPEPMTPAEAAATVPVRQQINDILNIKTPEEIARQRRQRRKDIQNIGKDRQLTPEEQDQLDLAEARGTRQYENLDESVFKAEERERNAAEQAAREAAAEPEGTAYEVGKQEPGSAPSEGEILRILKKPPFERTAEDKIKLRANRKQLDATMPRAVTNFLVGAGVTGAILADDDVRKAAKSLVNGVGGLPLITAMFIPVTLGKDLRFAEELHAAGRNRKDIWQMTGLFKGRDGVWRKEISDASAGFRIPPEQLSTEHPVPLGEAVYHEDLFRRYPKFRDIQLLALPESHRGKLNGIYNSKYNMLFINPTRTERQGISTILHELQHAVQDKGGMARGGSISNFLPPEFHEIQDRLDAEWRSLADQMIDKDVNFLTVQSAVERMTDGHPLAPRMQAELDKAKSLFDIHKISSNILRRRAMDQMLREAERKYYSLAGEVEARATQTRRMLTDQERRVIPPWEDYSVPEEDFIVQFQPGRSGAEMSVKEPGGMWHPEVSERLASMLSPLRETEAWALKTTKNYLNKYAGTEKDPLKDIEIPFRGGETIRWEDAWDRAIAQATIGDIPVTRLTSGEIKALQEGKISKNDPIHTLGPTYEQEAVEPRIDAINAKTAIKDYLKHVSDYLRQNVSLQKLPQYDLVRAVRETAANDARVAKEAEKAQVDATAELPVYKEYPNGFKWVELRAPEKLTEAQLKRVKKEHPESEDSDYIALGPDGEPVKNAYTGNFARGKTPEEAYLAGQLSSEGNQMGHCVGGYCEDVTSGQSRIYSLRDPKGQSHVTIEVIPHFTMNSAFIRDSRFSIQQIKGKSNRAPKDEYLPYVQDFVKSGDWNQVGDLRNAGLSDVHRTLQSLDINKHFPEARELPEYDALVRAQHQAVKQAFGDERFVPMDELEKVINDAREKYARNGGLYGPQGQQGFVDQKLLMGLGALGLGGIVGAELNQNDPAAGFLLGALAGVALSFPGARARLAETAKATNYGIGLLSTRIRNISEPVLHRARVFEMRNLSESYRYLHEVVPFMKALKRLRGERKAALERAILTNDPEAITRLMKGNPELVDSWRKVRNVLNELGKQLQGYGRFKSLRGDYFPRLVKDVEGLKKALDLPDRTRLENALLEADRQSIKTRGTPLTHIERSALINRELQAIRRARGFQPGFAKARGVEEITETLRPFYYAPAESLYAYVRGAVQDLEMAKFFGKDLAQIDKNGQTFIDIDTSVGNIVGRELAEGRITPREAESLADMLKSRFQGGERASNPLLQLSRNLGNIGLLGNIVAGATQLADAMMAIYAQDLRSTLTALTWQVAGKKVRTGDFGLADHVSEEFSSASRSANWLNKMFKYSGFSAIDRFGKSMQLNAALSRYTRLARTPKGVEAIRLKYGAAYGDEFPDLVRDLRAGNITPRVRALLFSELSDMQPVSKLELPQAYLDNPNGRIIYMLKTFMLKQFDIARRDILQELRKGNVRKGLKNGVEYALVLGISGATTDMIRNWLMGQPVDFNTQDVIENVLKTFGWGQYVRNKAASGHPLEAIAGSLAPPYRIMDDIIRGDPKAVQYIPILGKLIYNWELGGRERAEISKARQTGTDLSIRAEDYRRERRERAKERRESK